MSSGFYYSNQMPDEDATMNMPARNAIFPMKITG